MKRRLKTALFPLLIITLALSPLVAAQQMNNQISPLYGKTSCHLQSVAIIKFTPDEKAPKEIFVQEEHDGLTYSGYLQTEKIDFYNTGSKDVTYLGMLHLN